MDTRRLAVSAGLVLLASLGSTARAQAVAEYGRMARQSSTATAKGYHTAKEIGGVWKSLDNALQGSGQNTSAQESSRGAKSRVTIVRSSSRDAAAVSTTSAAYEPLDKIQPGLSHQELIRRFGPPSFEITDSTGITSVTYQNKDASVDLELQDGKVARISTPKAQQIAVAAPK